MGVKFQGITISLMGVIALFSGLGINALSGAVVKDIAGSPVHLYTPIGLFLAWFGVALILFGIAWLVLKSRYRVERR